MSASHPNGGSTIACFVPTSWETIASRAVTSAGTAKSGLRRSRSKFGTNGPEIESRSRASLRFPQAASERLSTGCQAMKYATSALSPIHNSRVRCPVSC